MEVTGFVKPFFWVLIGIAGVYFLALRPWRPRLMLASLSLPLDGLFLAALTVAALALFEPRPFDRAASVLIHQTALPDTLAEIDSRMLDLENMPERIWADIKAGVGWGDVEPSELQAPPLRPGTVEDAVLTAAREVVSMMLRLYAYFSGVIVSWVGLVVRIFSRSRAAAPRERAREVELTNRVVALELALKQATSKIGLEDPRTLR